jgi:hypothetical protein
MNDRLSSRGELEGDVQIGARCVMASVGASKMNFAKIGLSCFISVFFSIAAAGPSSAADEPIFKTPQSPSLAVWLGSAFKDHVGAGFVGGVWAANGSLDIDGFLFRGQYLYVGYDFNSALSPTGSANGKLNRGDAQVGYQIVRNGIASSLFLGVDYQNYSITPGVANDGRLDDKLGLIVTGRVAATGSTRFPFSLEGNYSTANSSYWVKARPGINLGQFTVGPEIGVLGNKTFDEARYGVYSSFNVMQGAILQLSVGYADRLRGNTFLGSNGNGAYGEVSLVFLR